MRWRRRHTKLLLGAVKHSENTFFGGTSTTSTSAIPKIALWDPPSLYQSEPKMPILSVFLRVELILDWNLPTPIDFFPASRQGFPFGVYTQLYSSLSPTASSLPTVSLLRVSHCYWLENHTCFIPRALTNAGLFALLIVRASRIVPLTPTWQHCPNPYLLVCAYGNEQGGLKEGFLFYSAKEAPAKPQPFWLSR